MTEQTSLSDVTLTMIVRDELMNPAGGLHAVLSRHLPYFQNVVVLDTGSVDGTRQLLEEMASEYSQLRVFDAEFNGYGHARVTANQFVKTKYTLMLDADERLKKPEDIHKEMEDLKKYPNIIGVSFSFQEVFKDGFQMYGGGWNPRLIEQKKVKFNNLEVWEQLDCALEKIKSSGYGILHFRGMGHGYESSTPKRRYWYDLFNYHLNGKIAPSQLPQFCEWKTTDPAVLLEYGVDVFNELRVLKNMGLQVHPEIIERLQKYGEGKQR